jgi:hypothetical protein
VSGTRGLKIKPSSFEETFMASYIVRVELHQATSADYETLHTKMDQAGFSRKIKAGDGQVYMLPTAEYSYTNTTIDREEVRTKVNSIASSVKINPAVLVTASNGSCWIGLKTA